MGFRKCLPEVIFLVFLLELVISWRQNSICCRTSKQIIKSFPSRNECKENRKHSLLLQSFASFDGIPNWLIDSCASMGFVSPTPLQQQALPEILSGNDIILQAQTGSGKTLCYALPILASVEPRHSAIQAVIIVPTRELGLQVAGVIKQLSSKSTSKLLIMSIFEGSHNRRQMLWATAEPPHVIVGNPRSLLNLVDQGKLRLNSVKVIVIDEVDACCANPEQKENLHKFLSHHTSNSFASLKDIEIQEQLDSYKMDRVYRDSIFDIGSTSFHGHRQTILCSATIPQRKYFAEFCFRNGWTENVPKLIDFSQDKLLPDNIKHEVVICKKENRLQLAAYFLKEHFRSLSAQDENQCILFVDNEEKLFEYMEYLSTFMEETFSASKPAGSSWRALISVLSGKMNIDQRRQSLSSFRDSNAKILICTDLATRGIDIPATSLVIQMSLPSSANDYLHRSGRTGRLDRLGKVITLIQEEEDFVVKRFMNELHFRVRKRKFISK